MMVVQATQVKVTYTYTDSLVAPAELDNKVAMKLATEEARRVVESAVNRWLYENEEG
jgi:hypothetical protein